MWDVTGSKVHHIAISHYIFVAGGNIGGDKCCEDCHAPWMMRRCVCGGISSLDGGVRCFKIQFPPLPSSAAVSRASKCLWTYLVRCCVLCPNVMNTTGDLSLTCFIAAGIEFMRTHQP